MINLTFLFKTKVGRNIIALVISKLNFILPVHRLNETDTLLVFHHPQPSYALHILLVPKKAIASLMELGSEDKSLLIEIIQTVQKLVTEYGLSKTGYRVIVNGGEYQDIPYLHFHLVTDKLPLTPELSLRYPK